MRTLACRPLFFALVALSFGLAPGILRSKAVHAPQGQQEQNVQVVEMTARKYEYSPTPVHVKVGRVQLKITAIDHDHGFTIAKFPEGSKSGDQPGLVFTSGGDCVQIKKGTTVVVEFVAQTPGTYPFHCCHVCGLGHGHMKSQLIVE